MVEVAPETQGQKFDSCQRCDSCVYFATALVRSNKCKKIPLEISRDVPDTVLPDTG
jgi:hypothetical protein